MKRLIFLCLVVSLILMSTFASDTRLTEIKPQPIIVKKNIDSLVIPLYFIPNQGQVHKNAQFYARASGYTLWLTKEGLIFDSVKKVKVEAEVKEETAPFGQIINAFGKDTNKNVPGKVFSPDIHDSMQSCNHASMQYHPHSPYSPHSTKIARDVSRLVFLNANKNPGIVPLEITGHRVNYFKGKDRSKMDQGYQDDKGGFIPKPV